VAYNNSNDPQFGDVQAALAAGAALTSPLRPTTEEGAGVYAVLPHNYHIENLEQFLPRPLRIEQDAALYDTDSFIGYVNEYKLAGSSHLFFDQILESFYAALDYHQKDTPSWCGHKATYKPIRSIEFATWMDSNRKQMTQVDFARFLEENLPDVVEPNSAELLQVALTFEAKKSVEFSSGVRLNNGQIQFQYDEVVRGTAQKGTIEIPEQFVLGVSIHVNGPAYRIPVRLRWRLQDGKVVFWYEVVRPHRFIADALKEIRERIAKETALPVLTGIVA
jgi:uncharacterized protein YfdQ (DUF2303 family)